MSKLLSTVLLGIALLSVISNAAKKNCGGQETKFKKRCTGFCSGVNTEVCSQIRDFLVDENCAYIPTCPVQQEVEVAVDCSWNSWGEWPVCNEVNCGGDKTRTRGRNVEAENGGAECVGEDSEIEQCAPCSVDCSWNSWGEWPVCNEVNCGGDKTRTRGRNVEAENGGAECVGEDSEIEQCAPCSVDCSWKSWAEWPVCNEVNCGGFRKRLRERNVEAENGGAECDGEYSQTERCGPCPELRLFKDNAKNDAVDGDSQYNYDDNFGTVRNSVNLKTGSEELREYDDKVSSVISFGGTWKLYDTEDRQKGMVVCPGQNYPKVIRNDKYTVIELVSDPNKLCDNMIVLYENKKKFKFMGILTEDVSKFDESYLDNDKASSLWAIKGNWELFDTDNYGKGKSIKICEGRTINDLDDMNDKISSARVMVEPCEIIDM